MLGISFDTSLKDLETVLLKVDSISYDEHYLANLIYATYVKLFVNEETLWCLDFKIDDNFVAKMSKARFGNDVTWKSGVSPDLTQFTREFYFTQEANSLKKPITYGKNYEVVRRLREFAFRMPGVFQIDHRLEHLLQMLEVAYGDFKGPISIPFYRIRPNKEFDSWTLVQTHVFEYNVLSEGVGPVMCPDGYWRLMFLRNWSKFNLENPGPNTIEYAIGDTALPINPRSVVLRSPIPYPNYINLKLQEAHYGMKTSSQKIALADQAILEYQHYLFNICDTQVLHKQEVKMFLEYLKTLDINAPVPDNVSISNSDNKCTEAPCGYTSRRLKFSLENLRLGDLEDEEDEDDKKKPDKDVAEEEPKETPSETATDEVPKPEETAEDGEGDADFDLGTDDSSKTEETDKPIEETEEGAGVDTNVDTDTPVDSVDNEGDDSIDGGTDADMADDDLGDSSGTGDTGANDSDNMDNADNGFQDPGHLIPLSRDDESVDDVIRKHVIQTYAFSNTAAKELGPEKVEELRAWCRTYLFLANIETTLAFVDNLGIKIDL
jgi:hypothetical protein